MVFWWVKEEYFPAKSIETPTFMIAASASKGLTILEKKVFVKARLNKVATLKNIQVQTTEPITMMS